MESLLHWYEPGEIRKMATSNAGGFSKMSGPNRYNCQEGALGIVAEGAYTDLNGNPLEDLLAVTHTKNLRIIMKDGVIYKDTLE